MNYLHQSGSDLQAHRAGVIGLDGPGWALMNTADLSDPLKMESDLNMIAGVVDNGLFAFRRADVLLVGRNRGGVDILTI